MAFGPYVTMDRFFGHPRLIEKEVGINREMSLLQGRAG
jgi:hypothetical protein